MPASPSCSAMTSSDRSARSSSASTCRPMCRLIGRCEASCPGRGAAFFTLLRRAGTHWSFKGWVPDQQLTTPRVRRVAQHPGHTNSRLLQRLLQILDQIVAVLEAGRESDKTFADAELGSRLRRQPLMRGGGRMGDEALGVAEIV